jgi:hypothetical protein
MEEPSGGGGSGVTGGGRGWSFGPEAGGLLARGFLAGQLQNLATKLNADVVWVERSGEPRFFDRYHPAEDRWERVDVPLVRSRIRQGRLLRGGGARLGLGGLRRQSRERS